MNKSTRSKQPHNISFVYTFPSTRKTKTTGQYPAFTKLQKIIDAVFSLPVEKTEINSIDAKVLISKGGRLPTQQECISAFPILDNAPLPGQQRIYFYVKTILTIREILTATTVKNCLKENKSYLSQTQFVMTPLATAGYITMRHPQALNKQKANKDIEEMIRQYMEEKSEDKELYCKINDPTRKIPIIETILLNKNTKARDGR